MAKTIDVKGVHYREVGEKLRAALGGEEEVILKSVNGQRYIGAGLSGDKRVTIVGTPGNDLAAYMDGLEILVKGNGQDGICNTMNCGRVIVEGDAGDIAGYAMRGGELFVRGSIGYRVGIHMKEYMDKIPAIVVGGKTGDFFGEYMAGGILIVLGLDLKPGEDIVGSYCGTGMHGGTMYIRGEVKPFQLGKEVKAVPMQADDDRLVRDYVERFCGYFGRDAAEVLSRPFTKLIPFDKRPYGNLYTPN